MEFIQALFSRLPCPPDRRSETKRLLDELLRIGKTDDFLSERPGPPFNFQCRHIRAREIGKLLDEIGGLKLMEFAHRKVRQKLGVNLSEHLDFAWRDLGSWR